MRNKPKTPIQTLSFILCTFIFMFFLMACTSDDGEADRSPTGDVGDAGFFMGSGRFIETERTLPEEAGFIFDLVELEDGTIRIIDQFGVLFESIDNGESWALSEVQYVLNVGEEVGYMFSVALNSTGGGFLSFERGTLYVDPQGEKIWVEVELPEPPPLDFLPEGLDRMEGFSQLIFTSNHQILGKSLDGICIFLIEPASGEVLLRFGREGVWVPFLDFVEIGGQLFALTSEGLDVFDLESGSLMEGHMVLKEHFRQIELEFIGFGIYEIRLFLARNQNALYIVGRTGLYRYTLGGSQLEQLINGALTTMSNTSFSFSGVLEVENNSFIISYLGMRGEGQRLMSYSFDPDAETRPSREMEVFSLFDCAGIRQVVSVFQSQNPHIMVNFEVGMSADDGAMTVSDAISVLNTRMLAGAGPDVLFLDGLPFETYIENGLLLELSQVVEDLKEENEFFDVIFEFMRKDGEIGVLPSAFSLLLVTGPGEFLDLAQDLASLTQLVEVQREMNPEMNSIMGHRAADNTLLVALHYVYSQMFEDDGRVNQEVLSWFLTDARRIYDTNVVFDPLQMGGIPKDIQWGSNEIAYWEPNIMDGLAELMTDRQMMNIGALSSLVCFDSMLAINEHNSWDYLVRGDFIPVNKVGINGMSNHLEESKDFLRLLFSPEIQSSAWGAGLPVNRGGIEGRFEMDSDEWTSSMSATDGLGGWVVLDVPPASVAQLNRLIEEIDQVDRPSVMSMMVLDVIFREGIPYLRGNQSLEEAVEGIIRSLNLYLME